MLAFALPGHDDATRSMGGAWVGHPSWEVVGAASEVAGRDIAELLLGDDDAAIDEPVAAHLATLVGALVGVDAAERLGLAPMAVAGFGAGELTALVAAGAISLDDGVRLAMRRGEAAAATISLRPCATATVLGLGDDDVEAACSRAEESVWVVGQLAPGHVEIAGTTEGVRRAGMIATTLGARRVLHHVGSSGLHTPLAGSARERYRKAIGEATFEVPDPVPFANVDARAHADPAEWPGLLSAQLCAPIRWRQGVEAMFESGVRTFLAFGSGAALVGAIRDCLPPRAVQAHTIDSPEDLETLVDRLIATPSLHRAPMSDHATLASRLVVASGTGPFRPAPDVEHALPKLAGFPSGDDGADVRVEVGDLLGWVGDDEVRSSFCGTLGGLLVIAGERVVQSQPVAWLQVDEAA